MIESGSYLIANYSVGMNIMYLTISGLMVYVGFAIHKWCAIDLKINDAIGRYNLVLIKQHAKDNNIDLDLVEQEEIARSGLFKKKSFRDMLNRDVLDKLFDKKK